MRRALLAAALLLAASGTARAQFVSSGAKLDQPAAQNVDEAKIIGRLYATFGYYSESESGGDGMQASPDKLLWTDLRARIEADHVSGSSFDVLGDFRIRLTPDKNDPTPLGQAAQAATTSRGWIGGNEYDLREAFVRYNAGTSAFSLGRLVLRDVDAMSVDGASFVLTPSPSYEYGASAGLFPNPYSRSFDTDYKFAADDQRSVTGYPVAAGAWGSYRTTAFYGSVGAGAILPRNTSTMFKEDNRVFLTARGYARVSSTVNFFHYGVLDVAGAAGTQLTNLQLGGDWMVTAPLRLELAYSHMSTYAIETYFRNYLETVSLNGSIINNLDVARMAADEGRAGANYDFGGGLDIFAQVRYRRRDAINTAALDPTIANLAPEAQLDFSAGFRKKDAFAGWELGANAAYIMGARTQSFWGLARIVRSFLEDRMDVDIDAGYVSYKDACASGSPVCGQATGSTLRGGAQVVFRQSAHWMYLGDLHLGYNSGDSMGTARGNVFETTGLARVQYSF